MKPLSFRDLALGAFFAVAAQAAAAYIPLVDSQPGDWKVCYEASGDPGVRFRIQTWARWRSPDAPPEARMRYYDVNTVEGIATVKAECIDPPMKRLFVDEKMPGWD